MLRTVELENRMQFRLDQRRADDTPDALRAPAQPRSIASARRRAWLFTSEARSSNGNGDVLNGTVFLAIPEPGEQRAGDHDLRHHGADAAVAMERPGVGGVEHGDDNERTRWPRDDEAGFSLIETMIAMGILATGLLSLAGVFIDGAQPPRGFVGEPDRARESARSGRERAHRARHARYLGADSQRRPTAMVRWRFVAGAQPLRKAGLDGLVNTADDAEIEVSVAGLAPDSILGNGRRGHTARPATRGRSRSADVLLTNGVPNPNLRRLQVTVDVHGGPVAADATR